MNSYTTTIPTNPRSTGTIEESIAFPAKKAEHRISKESAIRTDAGSTDRAYYISSPLSQQVLVSAKESIFSLSNPIVKDQTVKLISTIQFYLDYFTADNAITNRLPAINLLEREDTSVLVEWSFQSFRIGFALETIPDESNYYIVSEDRTLHQFIAETYPLGLNYETIVSNLIQYVIRNS